MATPSVHIALPQSSLFQIPPSLQPATLSPPISDFTLARPFNISEEWYNFALKPEVPLTIAVLYAFLITVGNRTNQERGWKPWAFSKTGLFFSFVVVHNVALALYSAWTFVGMANAYKNAWPGWDNEHGLVGIVDSLCKINGPRGLGSAATYNIDTQSWGIADPAMKLLDSLPDSTDVGRIWNEGLAFYGWLFYVSKFYEVVDTLIQFAKGKKSSGLQTFHHAGAMVCMWAGIRFMSPPIWMFVLVNSGIHGLMYTYYAISAFSIRIPPIVKKTITTLQITQFIFGASYAVAHLFISYDAPVNVPYLFTHNLSTALSSLPTSVTSALASATASAGIGNLLKKIALRAAGEEGLAENVRNKFGEPFGIDAVKAVEVEKAQEEIRYRMQSVRVNCIDTSGEAFAILLNVIYLAPLTYMFFRFFARSYNSRSSQQSTSRKLLESGRDATHEIKDEMKDSTALSNGNEDMNPPTDIKAELATAKERVRSTGAALSNNASTISTKAEELYEQGKDRLQKVKNEGVDGSTISTKAEELYEQGKSRLQEVTNGGIDGSAISNKVSELYEEGKDRLQKAMNGDSDGSANGDAEGHAEGQPDEHPDEHLDEHPDENPDGNAESSPVSSPDATSDQLDESSYAQIDAQPEDSSPEPHQSMPEKDSVPKEGSGDEREEKITDALKGEIGDAQAYEANIDEVKDEAEDQAEKEMQPEGV